MSEQASIQNTFCYVHADRVAGVRCQRCERHICPACMHAASVGFHCPECTRSGAKAQTLVSASLRGVTVPIATYVLIGINVAMYIITSVADIVKPSLNLSDHLSLVVFAQYPTGEFLGVAEGEWWRVVTHGFMHAGLVHLAFNMFALYNVGGTLERMIGRGRFLATYFVSMGGGTLLALLTTGTNRPTVGASGAIFGLFGAFLLVQLSRGLGFSGGITQTILVNLVITFVFREFISVGGHVGGLAAGAAAGVLLIGRSPKEARSRRLQEQRNVAIVAAVALALFVAALVISPYLAVNGPPLDFL